MEHEDTSNVIAERIEQLDSWLDDAAPYARFDQRHLDRGSPEQAYWHLGYRAALLDVRALIESATENKPDTSIRSPQVAPDE